VEVADGFGLGVALGVGVAVRVGFADDAGPVGETVAEGRGVTCPLEDFFFEEPPKPRITANAATATTIAV
jgi:hypothetical protein